MLASTHYTKRFFLTVRQNQRFVGIDTLDDAKVRWSLESQFDAFSLEHIQEMDVFHNHFVDMYESFQHLKIATLPA